MRSRLFIGVAAAVFTAAHAVHAQSSDRLSGGLQEGNYVRVSAGLTSPVNPQGSFSNWKSGTGLTVGWENWQGGGSSGVGILGLALTAGYSLLPLDESDFTNTYSPLNGGRATSASASKGGLFELSTGLRLRIPSPVVVPTINFSIGFIHWAPGKINFSAPSGDGSVKQQSRTGAELTIGAGLQRFVAGRVSVFADAAYVYGLTSLGRSSATPGGVCSGASSCDVLKNTAVTNLRAGLAVFTSR